MTTVLDVSKMSVDERIDIACQILLHKLSTYRGFRPLRLESMTDTLMSFGLTTEETLQAIDQVNRAVPLGIPN